ncbi:hypothetical protein JZO70_06230 [Enterococcus sp. 669A]|uniref:Alternate signal-mediated exported protein n=1 Tax=Candidatus Enterococcus moelleringii TaxID=2815325 RepID=A0ABS3LAI3_9ENTE|nr:hypothetical protein [Enterococcus sp. 669A]MBO1305746.1 hypothetical protein [Enterococcus sp. 669A]
MKNNKRKKKMLAAAAVLALIAAMSGTFAWLTAQDQAINRAASAVVKDDSVTISEKFTPIPLMAGTSTEKEVKVKNTGTADVFVRVSYEEVLKHLADKGNVTYGADNSQTDGTNPKYTDVPNDPGLDKHMPVEFDWAKSVAEGFVVSEGTVTGKGTDPNVLLLITGQRIVNPLDPADINHQFTGQLVHRYRTDTTTPANNKYQIMSFDSLVLDSDNGSTDPKDWDFTVGGVKFGYYKDGYKHSLANWATSKLAPTGQAAPTGRAVLGETGNRHNVEFDYTAATLGTTLPSVTPVTGDTKGQLPEAGEEKSVQADQVDPIGKGIKVKYSADITDTTTMDSDKWVYNPEDGWFYYTTPVKAPIAGSTSETKPLIERLIFDGSMGKEYNNASYDLVVKMEAIFADREALTGTEGWTMDTTAGSDSLKIVDKLAPVTP